MKLITANKLNRFWKKGVKPIVDSIALKFEIAKIVRDMNTINALTQEGYVPDALLIKQLNNNLTQQITNASRINTYVGADGKLHFTNSAGADTVLNFSRNFKVRVTITGQQNIDGAYHANFVSVYDIYYRSGVFTCTKISGTDAYAYVGAIRDGSTAFITAVAINGIDFI